MVKARYGECPEAKSGRIVATVPPFSAGEPPRGSEIRHKDPDPLQESGIFEETHYSCRGTQTDLVESPGDLSQVLRYTYMYTNHDITVINFNYFYLK